MKLPAVGLPSLAVLAPLLFLVRPGPVRPGDAEAPEEIALREGLVLKQVGRHGRNPVPHDALEALFVAGKWAKPRAGDTVALADGSRRTWEEAKAGPDGTLKAAPGSYAYFTVPSTADRVMILEARGHAFARVNGEPRTGDPYATGYVRLPVALHKGDNDLLFHCGRGLKARLVAPKAPAFLDAADTTLPDLVVGTATDAWGALLVINATTEALDGLTLEATVAGGDPERTPLPPLPPCSTRKAGFLLKGPPPTAAGDCAVAVALLRRGQERPADTARLTLRVRRPEQTRKCTFRSGIDGSVQYYAVNPAQPVGRPAAPPALFLTLHGAAVEAIGQADAYSAKTWGHLVAPTNRRPYGFDWEDWGRLDALEVLALARKTLRTDPARTYLTGHSMGGHGVWHLGATYPDRFAAIGPSAGWVSMWSYAGASRSDRPTPAEDLLLRAASPSDTLALVRNYAHHGVYVLHGSADDNVPVGQARQMRAQLAGFHHDFVYHEQPGAGHWWDASDEPGADCVDWAPMFDLFARHVIPAAVPRVP
jgi:poly(3-hydroxybutyrate) depolymerase